MARLTTETEVKATLEMSHKEALLIRKLISLVNGLEEVISLINAFNRGGYTFEMVEHMKATAHGDSITVQY